MVYTLTMHPAVDLFLHAQGDVPERRGAAVQAGGKGVNVSRFLRRLGRPSRCVVLCGGARGQFLVARRWPKKGWTYCRSTTQKVSAGST